MHGSIGSLWQLYLELEHWIKQGMRLMVTGNNAKQTPISAEPSMPQSDTVFTRALAKLSLAELRALWAAEGDIPATFRLRQCEYREAHSAVAEPRRNSS